MLIDNKSVPDPPHTLPVSTHVESFRSTLRHRFPWVPGPRDFGTRRPWPNCHRKRQEEGCQIVSRSPRRGSGTGGGVRRIVHVVTCEVRPFGWRCEWSAASGVLSIRHPMPRFHLTTRTPRPPWKLRRCPWGPHLVIP